ncbi:hypothetical protein J6590_055860 [Homalodisca vitripennis]|nr:hypothetical protein J6590_055860 [Homalodisca vitripennis]
MAILTRRIKNSKGEQKLLKMKDWRKYRKKTLANTRKNYSNMGSNSTNHFSTSKTHEHNPEMRNLGTTHFEAKRYERRVFTCEQLHQKQSGKVFCIP